MTATSPLLTIPEACRYLRRSKTFVWEHRAELGCVKLGRNVLFTQVGLDAYIARQTVPPAVTPAEAPVKRLAVVGRTGTNPVTKEKWGAARLGGRAQ